jgi:sulfur-oxidizing protein SoxY
MAVKRRTFLEYAAALGMGAVAGFNFTREVWAQAWNKAGFEAKTVTEVMKSLGAVSPIESKDIVITAPDIAENGAVVPVAVTSRIPNTESIAIVTEKNPFPLAATFDVTNGAEPYISTRIKMGETSNVRAVVKAAGKHYSAVKEVKVTIGGCG